MGRKIFKTFGPNVCPLKRLLNFDHNMHLYLKPVSTKSCMLEGNFEVFNKNINPANYGDKAIRAASKREMSVPLNMANKP